MKLEEQLKVVTDTIEELKGEDIVTLKVLKQSADIEAVVVTQGDPYSMYAVLLTILRLKPSALA